MILDKDVASSRQWAHRAPEGWHQALASYYQTTQKREQQRFSPASVIVPIHDEERSLESFFNAVTSADLSPDHPLKWFLITNSCSDSSPEIVRKFLFDIDPNTEALTMNTDTDAGVSDVSLEARVGKMSFTHLNTSTRGKANALRLGNELALRNNHHIAMSIDANVYPEADALRILYESSDHEIVQRPQSGIVVLHGSAYREHRPTPYSKTILRNKKGPKPSPEVRDLSNVNGWMIGWNTSWFKTIEDRIQVAVEDYAIGLLARTEGYHTLKIPEMKIWGYKGSTLGDDFRERVRAMRGMIQLIDQEPSLTDQVQLDNVYMRPFVQRIAALISRLSKKPTRSMLQMVNFGLYEIALLQARREFAIDPKNQSWPEIVSSK